MWDNTGYTCEACMLPTVQTYDYVDRHGDIEQLCATCYCAALNPAELPTLPARVRLMAWLCLFGVSGFLAWKVLL